MSHVLVAPDKFKGSLTGLEVGRAIARGLRRVRPDLDVVVTPVADGGDGTLVAALAAGYDEVELEASGPTGEPVTTSYARRGDRAVVEMAAVSGLERLPGGRFEPLTATSRGTGEVLAAAIDAGCRRITVGIGGSASTDGGSGMIQALGAVVLDAAGFPVGDGGSALADAATIDLTALRQRLEGAEIMLACDVDNPLLGEHGAAAVYGPQKGAGPDDVERLDAALAHWADVVTAATGADLRDRPGAGAAGGVGFAAIATLGASLRPGIELVLDFAGFHDRLSGAALVITGEGSFDEQSLRGKAPIGVADAARAQGVPVVVVCGRTTLDDAAARDAGIDQVYALSDLEPDLDRSIAHAAELLERIAAEVVLRHLPARSEQPQ